MITQPPDKGDGTPDAPLLIDLQMLLCPVHGEPFRGCWPSGYPTFAALATRWLLHDDATAGEVGGDVARLRVVLLVRPACSRMGAEKLLEFYRKINATDEPLWQNALCSHCDRVAACFTVQRKNHWGRVTGTINVCLECTSRMECRRWG